MLQRFLLKKKQDMISSSRRIRMIFRLQNFPFDFESCFSKGCLLDWSYGMWPWRGKETDEAVLKRDVHLFSNTKEGMIKCLLLFYIIYFFLIFGFMFNYLFSTHRVLSWKWFSLLTLMMLKITVIIIINHLTFLQFNLHPLFISCI